MVDIKKNTLYLSISSVLFMLTGYLLNIFLGRLLGPIEYGTYGVILTFITLVNTIQSFGIPQATSKLLSQNEPEEVVFATSFYLQMILSTLFFLITFFSSSLIAAFLGDIEIKPLLQIASFSFLTYGIFSLILGYLNGRHQFLKQAKISILYYFAKTLLVLMLTISLKLYGALIGFVLSPLISIIFGFIIPRKLFSKNTSYRLVMLSIPLVGFAFLSTMLQSIDIFLVKYYLPLGESSGYYAASQNISRIVYFSSSALPTIIFPLITKNFQEQNEKYTKKIVTSFFRYATLFIVPLCLLISAKSSFIVNLFYGVNYLESSSSLSILALSYGLLTLFVLLANVLNGAGELYTSLFIACLGAIIAGVLCIQLIPQFGLIGAALSTGVGNTVAVIIAGWKVRNKFGVFMSISTLLRISIAAVITYLLVMMINSTASIDFLLLFITPLFFYILLYLMKELDPKEISMFLELISRKK